MIRILDLDALEDKDYKEIKNRLLSSELIVYPTETSYGLGANALDDSAVQKIYGLKTRDRGKPLPVLVKNTGMLMNIAKINRREEDIISKFWPGPLTIVFNLKPKQFRQRNYLFAAGLDSVGARISPNPFVSRLFEEIDFPLVATSANISGEESISDFDGLKEKFLSRGEASALNIAAINAGELSGGSSTVIKAGKKGIEILREGDNNLKKRFMCYINNNAK